MLVKVLDNQNLLDIAIRHCGTVQAVFDIAISNGLSITADLMAGQQIKIPDVDYGEGQIVNYFITNKIDPATAFDETSDSFIDYSLPNMFPISL